MSLISFIADVQVKLARIALEAARQSVVRMAESPKGVTWTWDNIKGFGETKALKTSFLFLFLVPLAARLLSNIPDEVTVPIFNKMVEIPLGLPFSWFVLFMSACFASIGNIIYAAFCPELIKKLDYADASASFNSL